MARRSVTAIGRYSDTLLPTRCGRHAVTDTVPSRFVVTDTRKDRRMNKRVSNRREFLETMGAVALRPFWRDLSGRWRHRRRPTTRSWPSTAGNPCGRTRCTSAFGPQFYDDVEKKELMEVLESKYPFRWWGENSKVLQFEQSVRGAHWA